MFSKSTSASTVPTNNAASGPKGKAQRLRENRTRHAMGTKSNIKIENLGASHASPPLGGSESQSAPMFPDAPFTSPDSHHDDSTTGINEGNHRPRILHGGILNEDEDTSQRLQPQQLAQVLMSEGKIALAWPFVTSSITTVYEFVGSGSKKLCIICATILTNISLDM
jgi:hypothetical protein